MPTAERTYSFRGSQDLYERVSNAVDAWVQVGTGDAPSEDVMRVFALEVLRRIEDLEAARGNQSALFRLITEVFAVAAEKVAAERAAIRDYEEWAREDVGAQDLRAGALRSAAERWRDA